MKHDDELRQPGEAPRLPPLAGILILMMVMVLIYSLLLLWWLA